MFFANVGICFASNVEMNLIDPVIVQQLLNGVKRTLMRVKISLGLWLTLNSAHNVENQLRKIKGAII